MASLRKKKVMEQRKKLKEYRRVTKRAKELARSSKERKKKEFMSQIKESLGFNKLKVKGIRQDLPW